MNLSADEIDSERRRFSKWAAMGLLAGLYPGMVRSGMAKEQVLKVAALQMTPKLGDVEANLQQAEQLILQAQRQGAQWIVLPEMFTSAVAFHPDMPAAIRPLDGAPAQMMKRLARQGGSVIGGSFLASEKGHVHNSFLLAFPDGHVERHDKDQPTYWENCFYRGGSDDGILTTSLGNVGSALCWEFIRSATMRRLQGKVRLVLGGSCWWTLSDDVDADNPLRADNHNMARQAPIRCARMLGVPVVHAAHTGAFNGFFSPDLPDVPYDSVYLGETMVVDAAGQVLSQRRAHEGAGVVVAEIRLAEQAMPSLPVPSGFWMPQEMPEPWKESWTRWLGTGKRYYETVTRPYLQTGEFNEYIPEYML